MEQYLAIAALDNVNFPEGCQEVLFTDFAIRVCPNHARPYSIELGDGSTDVDWQYPDQPDLRYPVCDYYLETHFEEDSSNSWKQAEQSLMWALNRLRLFKDRRLWGSLHSVIEVHRGPYWISGDENVELMRQRRHTKAPVIRGFWPFPHIYDVCEADIKPMIEFVERIRDAPRQNFEVALRRFHMSFDRDLVEDQAIDWFIALESLFSEDSEAIGHKIALRVAYLLEIESNRRKELFSFLKKAYGQRSTIVHGKGSSSWLAQKSFNSRWDNAHMLRDILRRALTQLLEYAQKGVVLIPSKLDDHLFFSGY